VCLKRGAHLRSRRHRLCGWTGMREDISEVRYVSTNHYHTSVNPNAAVLRSPGTPTPSSGPYASARRLVAARRVAGPVVDGWWIGDCLVPCQARCALASEVAMTTAARCLRPSYLGHWHPRAARLWRSAFPALAESRTRVLPSFPSPSKLSRYALQSSRTLTLML
jgi:hypothetical protein